MNGKLVDFHFMFCIYRFTNVCNWGAKDEMNIHRGPRCLGYVTSPTFKAIDFMELLNLIIFGVTLTSLVFQQMNFFITD